MGLRVKTSYIAIHLPHHTGSPLSNDHQTLYKYYYITKVPSSTCIDSDVVYTIIQCNLLSQFSQYGLSACRLPWCIEGSGDSDVCACRGQSSVSWSSNMSQMSQNNRVAGCWLKVISSSDSNWYLRWAVIISCNYCITLTLLGSTTITYINR